MHNYGSSHMHGNWTTDMQGEPHAHCTETLSLLWLQNVRRHIFTIVSCVFLLSQCSGNFLGYLWVEVLTPTWTTDLQQKETLLCDNDNGNYPYGHSRQIVFYLHCKLCFLFNFLCQLCWLAHTVGQLANTCIVCTCLSDNSCHGYMYTSSCSPNLSMVVSAMASPPPLTVNVQRKRINSRDKAHGLTQL